jgi:hypothetical protein
VCEQHVPINAEGKVVYKIVPFWDQKYCPTHDDRFRCCSCQRIEVRICHSVGVLVVVSYTNRTNGAFRQPSNPRKYFEVLSDGRKTCHDCAMSVVLDTNEVRRKGEAFVPWWLYMLMARMRIVWCRSGATARQRCVAVHAVDRHPASFRGCLISLAPDMKSFGLTDILATGSRVSR